MIDLFAQPLATAPIVPRSDRARAEIERLALVRPRFVHAPLLGRLVVDGAEWWRYGREERGPGRRAPRAVCALLARALAH